MKSVRLAMCVVATMVTIATAQTPLGTAFTYQGQLKNAGSPAGGGFNMVFKLFDAATLGNQVGPTLTFDGAGGNPPPVSVTNGLFTVGLDFGAVFSGQKRWLQVMVSGTTLSPRQELTAAPYSFFASGNQPRYVRTIVVQPVVGDAVASGTALVNALAGITDASATNMYLLKIEPGVYDFGSGSLQMKSYVDIEGSGEFVTRLTALGGVSDTDGTVRGANNAEIRLCTIENRGSNNFAICIGNNSVSPRITQVTLTVPPSTPVSANSIGISNRGSSAVMTQVTIEMTNVSAGVGVFNQVSGSSPLLRNSRIRILGDGADGIRSIGATPTLDSVSIDVSGGGVSRGIYNSGPSGTSPMVIRNCDIASSQISIDGGAWLMQVESTRLTGTLSGTGTNLKQFLSGALQRAEFMDTTPNLIAGYKSRVVAGPSYLGNQIVDGAAGAMIGGGGAFDDTIPFPNLVSDDYGTVVGGRDNRAGDLNGSPTNASFATVGGGDNNRASGAYAIIPGGRSNLAGGDYSLAAGRRAKTSQDGAFVWADSTDADFTATAANQFLIRAGGGTGIGTAAPENTLHVFKASAGTVTGNSNAPLIVENSTSTYINILAPDANEQGILFGKPTGGSATGGIIYDSSPTTDGFQFRANGNITRMVIDGSGNVGIATGAITPGAKLDVRGDIKLGPSGEFQAPAAEERLRVLRGDVSASGVAIAGAGWTSARTATGDYTITFSTAFSATPAVTPVAVDAAALQTAVLASFSTTSARIRTFNSGGSLVDTEFHFVAVGPR